WFLSDLHEIHELEHTVQHSAAHVDAHDDHGHGKKDEKKEANPAKKDAKAEQEAKDKRMRAIGELNALKNHWLDSIDWAHLYVDPRTDYDIQHIKAKDVEALRVNGPASVLKLGYRIDMLSAVMFVMVTFIA